ncbi:caffeine-induced death protein 1 [Seiridium cupressi]
MMPVPQESGPPLEDHLRNLILHNTGNAASTQLNNETFAAGHGQGNVDPSIATDTGNKPVRKRPNQAQRRQMSSQTTIDIDPRATAPQPSRSYAAQPGFNRGPVHGFHPGPPRHPHGHRGGFHGHHPSHERGHHPPHHHHHQHHRGHGSHSMSSPAPPHQQSWRQHPPYGGAPDRGVNVIQSDAFVARPPRNTHGSLYNPEGHRQYVVKPEELTAQSELLDRLCATVVQDAEIGHGDILEKENFRGYVESICRAVVSEHEVNTNGASGFEPNSVQLMCFGSLASGFATKTADMDLGLISPNSKIAPDAPECPLPRLIERALLDAGFGARLLTRTRVPIIKLCEKPTATLRADLLEERTKWEQGLTENEHVAEEAAEGGESLVQTSRNPAPIGASDGGPSNALTQADTNIISEKGNDLSSQQLLSSFKQSKNQTLLAYHNQAKKFLRQLGGRDVTHSNLSVFTDADYLLLDDVSKAFVEGLYDRELRDRVMMHNSFSCGKYKPNRRTLHGVCNMVEGETLVMLWETRAIPEGDPRTEQTYSKTVQLWAEFHKTRSFGLDPLGFNREMSLPLERLRKFPSIQLMQLQQQQYESAADYHERAVKIMAHLNATALAASEPGVLPPAVGYYVSGIQEEDIRIECERFIQQTDTKNIRAVARRHRSLHLANEYARALEKGGLYEDNDVPTIQEYIKFLQSDLLPASSPHSNDYQLPIRGAMVRVYSRILELPNPAQLAPNQPKDRYHDRLEFPQSGIGVQCDINFSAHLALHNSHLLRCYAATDPRVRPMVLFIKHWAKARDINTPYRGTLSSYGYVLMVIHYLVNIVQPFVSPNLQILAPEDPDLPPEELEGITTCKGHNVRFWRDEQEIQRLSHEGVLNGNRDSIGYLLRGFFEYYAQNNMMSTIQKRGFDWGRDVLSLRTPGGLLSKQEKNWVQAKTVIQTQTGAPPTPTALESPGLMKSPTEEPSPRASGANIDPTTSPDGTSKPDLVTKPQELKEVRHRYLFAIEDPFELEHNVARTVTHHGIVAIRDEFRRAWRIIKAAGKTAVQEDLLENVKIHAKLVERKQFADLLSEIHGEVIDAE